MPEDNKPADTPKPDPTPQALPQTPAEPQKPSATERPTEPQVGFFKEGGLRDSDKKSRPIKE